MTGSLEQRLQRLEDIQEIQNLQALYARHTDSGWEGASGDRDALANLFTEDGVWTSPQIGTYEGRAAIREGLAQGRMIFAMHLLLSPVIEIQGDEATANWRALFALTTAQKQPLLGGGGYEVRYRRTPEGWRIEHLRTQAGFMSPYGQSWA